MDEQPGLLFELPPPPLEPPVVVARSSDPETAQEANAATEAQGERNVKAIEAVEQLLETHGPMTDFEIRDRWKDVWEKGWSYTLPCKARQWAREAGRVKHDGFGEHEGRRVRRWSLGRDDAWFHRERCSECGRLLPTKKSDDAQA